MEDGGELENANNPKFAASYLRAVPENVFQALPDSYSKSGIMLPLCCRDAVFKSLSIHPKVYFRVSLKDCWFLQKQEKVYCYSRFS